MKILTKNDILKNTDFYLNEIKKGKIFIYPTDTLYGIGCVREVRGKRLEVKRKLERLKSEIISLF